MTAGFAREEPWGNDKNFKLDIFNKHNYGALLSSLPDPQ